MTPSEFKGGEGSQCFKVLRSLGFIVEPKPGTTLLPVEDPQPAVPATLPSEIAGQVWIEFRLREATTTDAPSSHLGQALLSPRRGKKDQDSYRTMRLGGAARRCRREEDAVTGCGGL